MGYRNYISKIKKEDYVEGQDWWDYDDDKIIELHELGKYVDSEVRDGLITIGEDIGEDGEFVIIDVESIPHIVDCYAKSFVKFLESLNNGENRMYDHESYIEEQIRRWSNAKTLVYNIDKDKEKLVSSWEFQYELFDLVRIYKTFDTEKYHLLWLGH